MNINKDITYIHYGHNQFDIDKFLPIKNLTDFIKPKEGCGHLKLTQILDGKIGVNVKGGGLIVKYQH